MSDANNPTPILPGDDDDRRKLISNERIKSSASLMNSAAAAMLGTGVIGPVAAELYGLSLPKSPYWWVFGTCWLGLGVGAHILARYILGDLKP